MQLKHIASLLTAPAACSDTLFAQGAPVMISRKQFQLMEYEQMRQRARAGEAQLLPFAAVAAPPSKAPSSGSSFAESLQDTSALQ
ncbi:hypothetical protein Efla_003386 [Eimeria flavescens]